MTIVLSNLNDNRASGSGSSGPLVTRAARGLAWGSVLSGTGKWQATWSPLPDVFAGTAVWVDDTRGAAAAPDTRAFDGPPNAVQFVDQSSGAASVWAVELRG